MSKSMSSYFGQDPFEAFDEGVKLFVEEIARQADWVMESGIFLPSIYNNLSPSIWLYHQDPQPGIMLAICGRRLSMSFW